MALNRIKRWRKMKSKAVIVATGATARWLSIPGERNF